MAYSSRAWLDGGVAPADPLATLLARARGGDAGALASLLQAAAPVMLAAARTVLGPTDADLDDVLQDGLCALRRAIASFRGDSSFLHFARRIAVKQALMVRRRRGVHQRAVAALTLSEEPADEPTAGGGERRQALRELLDQLRPEQAEALVLYSVLDLSLDEVAAASDCPRNTVRSRLRLAKDHVRQLLRDQPLLASKLGVEP